MGTQPQPQPERLVIGITGRIGSGKTTVGKYLESKYAFQYLRYSAVLADWRLANSHNKSQLQKVGWEVMASGMQSDLNKHLIARIDPGKNAAVDGLRHLIDYESLSGTFRTAFHLLYIDCGSEYRWNHLKGSATYATRASFEAADANPVEQQIDSLRPKANVVIRNEGSLANLYAGIDTSVRSFRKEGQK